MRKVIDAQMAFGRTDISAIRIDPKCRDDITRLMRGLQYIYTQPELRKRVFAILEGMRPVQADGGPLRIRNLKHVKLRQVAATTYICWLWHIVSLATVVTGCLDSNIADLRRDNHDRKRCTNDGACPEGCFHYFRTRFYLPSEMEPFRTVSR